MSSNFRWFLEHSSSFKAEHEKKFVLYTIILNLKILLNKHLICNAIYYKYFMITSVLIET